MVYPTHPKYILSNRPFGEPMAQRTREIYKPGDIETNLVGVTSQHLARNLSQLGIPAVHARTLFRRMYKDLAAEPWADPTLPRGLAAHLRAYGRLELPTIKKALRSGYDQSVKFLLELSDGREIEAVLMPEKARLTLCLSSQVGCAQACVFCHTGRMGLTRQLSAGEIVGQLLLAQRWLADNTDWLQAVRLAPETRISNVVFMGMGEPLDNVDAVNQAVTIMTDPYGLALGLAHISVSTAGHLDGIRELYAAHPKARLALSVHSAFDSKRSRIMPINRRWPLAEVVAWLREHLGADGPPVMFQYTMIAGVNDSDEDSEALAALTVGLNAKINLIPLNDVATSRLAAPDPGRIQAFRDHLHRRGIRVMVRYSKGQDIAAACGQLVAIESKAKADLN
ncbi:MAG: hypothetical protein RL011_1104 [Pseudomonadota bacterium]|jgi:23S rRNA (adenine2503-C2)-methyltransferase